MADTTEPSPPVSRASNRKRLSANLTPEAADLLDQNRSPGEPTAAVVIRALLQAKDRLKAELAPDLAEDDYFFDPASPALRHRVRRGTYRYFYFTQKQAKDLKKYMEYVGATNLSYMVDRAIIIAFGGDQKKGSPGCR